MSKILIILLVLSLFLLGTYVVATQHYFKEYSQTQSFWQANTISSSAFGINPQCNDHETRIEMWGDKVDFYNPRHLIGWYAERDAMRDMGWAVAFDANLFKGYFYLKACPKPMP